MNVESSNSQSIHQPDAPTEPIPWRGQARILIVDDEQTLMEALRDTLKHHGYDTFGQVNPAKALELLRQSRFDLMLCDLMMPEMDGIALLKSALQIDPNLVGVIMTGQGSIDTAVEAMKAGALDFILKPFKLSVILPVLSRALDVRRLRQENAALEQRLLERTAALEATNQELEAFAGSVAHDLQAPARHIIAFAKLLEEESSSSLNASSQQYLSRIVTATARLSQLIADLLHFSRLAHTEMKHDLVDLNQLVAEARRNLEPDLQDREIRWTVGKLPMVQGDASLLQQVFYNLLSNALKYTSRRAVAEIEVGAAQGPDQSAVIFVRDNGIGFDMAHAKKLFQVFSRLHGDDDFKGTGVGLANVRRIITRHGGSVRAEAAIDKGATFYVSLPAAADA